MLKTPRTPPPSEPAEEPRRRRPGRWLIIAALCVVALITGLGVTLRYGPLTPWGRQVIEAQLTGLKVGQLGRLRVEGLEGDVWRAFTVRRLDIADAKGAWIEARDLSVRWRWAELFERRVRLTAITARTITLIRRPELGPSGKPGGASPVSIRIDAARARVEMLPAFSYRRGVYDLAATAIDVGRKGSARGAVSAASALHAGDFLRAVFDVGHNQAFTVTADALEAKGGALAGALGLAADQPFSLTARAKGSASQGAFSLETRVGAVTPLEARGAWNKAGGSADGRVELAASTLLARYQKMVGPEARLHLTGAKAPDGFYTLALDAQSQNVTLTARGEGDLGKLATGPRGLAITARVADPSLVAPLPKTGPASLAAVLTGDQKHWLLAGNASLDHPTAPDFTLARLAGPVRLESRGGELVIDASAAGEGGAGKGLVAALLGGRPRASAQVSQLAEGRLLIRKLTLQGVGLDVSASGERGLLGGLDFKGQATLTNLAAAHPGARGLVKAAWSASQGSGDKPWSFSFDAKGQDLAAGFGDLDHLLGAAPRLQVKAAYGADILSVASLSLDGAAGGLTSAGQVGPAGALKLKLDWRAQGPLTVGPLEIGGGAKGSGEVTGTLASPRADLLAHVDAIDLPVLPLKDAQIRLGFMTEPGGVGGRFAIGALSQYGPAKASADFRFVSGGLDLSGVDVNAGGVTVGGAVALLRGEPSSADLTVAIGPGAILTEGRANGRVRVVDAPGGPKATLDLEAAGAVLRQGGLMFKTLKLTADGPLRRLPYTVSAQGARAGGPWKLAGSGLYSETTADRTASFSGTGRVGRADLKTLGPAQVTFGDQGTSGRAELAIGSGRVNIDFSQGAGAIKANATASNLSLELISEDYIGHVDGTLNLAGRGAALTGDIDAKLTGAGGRDLKGAPPVNGEITARLGSDAITLDASLGSAQGLKAHTHVTLPAEASAAPFRIAINRVRPMHGDFAVDGELGPLWDLLMGGERSLSGRVAASGTLGGTLADPQAVGTAALDKGRFRDVETGLTLDGVTLRAVLSADAVNVSQFSGADGAKGTLAGSGRISLDRDGVSSFRLDLKGFRLIDNDLAQAIASGSVGINRAADGKVKLTGALTMDHAQIAPNPPVPSGVTPMDVVEIHRPDADDTPVDTAKDRTAPVALDVSLKAARGVFVKGRGLNVELSLDAHVGGDTNNPALTGEARVVRGDYDFAGQRFQLDDHSVIRLGSTPETIRLDLTATRDNPTLTAVIRIQGTAARPTITLSSTPTLPQDEILSQVLFGASAAQLSPLQAAQLASALAALSGSGGFDVIGGLRNLAHLDRLAIGGSATPTSTLAGTKYVNQSNTVAGGKYLRDNVYLEIAGGGAAGPSAQVEWRVKKHLSIVSKLAGQGESTLSVRWRKDY